MPTLGDLKQRIIAETTRDDLADDLKAQFETVIIPRAIDHYAAERWWFNERRFVQDTVPGQDYLPWPLAPNAARWIDGVYLEQNSGNTRWPITIRSIDEFEELRQPNTTGQPTDALVADDIVRLFPIPNAIYQVAWDLIVDVTPVLV